jgi:hypothetical protein
MIKNVVIASGLLVFAGATVASERPTVAESNGFKACLAAAERDAKYLRVDDTYYINHGEESRTYYLNGVGRTPETAGRLRIACETDASGRRVTDLAVQEGRFVPRFANNEVASN